MDCRIAQDELAALSHGELDDEARREIDAHLRQCPACAREAEEIRGLFRSIRDVPLPDPSPAVWAKVEQSLDADAAAAAARLRAALPAAVPASRRRAPSLLPIALGGAAAAALLIAAALLLFRDLPARDPSPRPATVATATPSAGAEFLVASTAGERRLAGPVALGPADRLRIVGNAGAVLITSSGARVVAAAGSDVAFTGPLDLSLARGAALIEGNGTPRLTVTTPAARVVPVGTRFLVAHETETSVVVEEGLVRFLTGGGAVDIPAGFSAAAGRGAAPAPARAEPEAAARLQRHQEAAAPSGLRLLARLDPPQNGRPDGTARRLVVRIEKVPGVGLPVTCVSTVGSGHAYLTCAAVPGAPDPSGAPAPIIPLDPSPLDERGDLQQGMARIAPPAPYEIAGVVDLAGVLAKVGGPARIVIAYVCRRPPGRPEAWSGQITSAEISVPGAGSGR